MGVGKSNRADAASGAVMDMFARSPSLTGLDALLDSMDISDGEPGDLKPSLSEVRASSARTSHTRATTGATPVVPSPIRSISLTSPPRV